MISTIKYRLTMLTGVLLILAYMTHISDFSLWSTILLISSTMIAGLPILIKAVQSLRMRSFGIEILVSIAVVGALFIEEYVESAVVSFLFLFGAYLEARTLEKTRSSLKMLMDMAPTEATVLRNGEKIVLHVDELGKGDHVFIQSGEKVAIDGIIISGTAYINEATITGESVPATKKVNDSVFSGTIIDHGYIEVIAENIGDDTAYAKIIELVEEAQEIKTKMEKFLVKFSKVYTPAIVVLSLLVFLFTRNLEFTLTFLVIACPGALVISAPVSMVAGVGNGAKHGVLIKGGEVMEQMATIDTVIFDKTGTLTQGNPAVTDIMTLSLAENELLRWVAEAEVVSEHHLGQTIVKEAVKRGLSLKSEAEHVKIIKGYGIAVFIAGKQLHIGNRKLMAQNEIIISPSMEGYATQSEQRGNTAIFVAINGEAEGIISIADPIRPEAKEALEKLRKYGIKEVYMLTGDNRHTAELVGSYLGVDHVLSEMLPEDKVEKVRELRRRGLNVAMVGDGINDAPAIATADIGIAMKGSGTDITMETADVVLMADNLDRIAYTFALAKATVRNMKQNTFFAVGTVILLLLGVLMQKIFLASGMLIHELSVLIVILNASRVVRLKHKNPLERDSKSPLKRVQA